MMKLFKYEWKKQMFSKVVIAFILLVLVLVYLAGMALKRDSWMGVAMVLMWIAGVFCAMYVGIESLLVLNRDIRTKESYMLFMVPKSAYQILGAKILAAICQILLTLVMFGAAFMICFTAYMAANEGLAGMLNYLRRYAEQLFEVRIDWDIVLQILVSLCVGWIHVIAAGFAAIISVRTVLSRTKLAGLIALIVFFLLNWGSGMLSNKVSLLATGPENEMMFYWLSLGVTAVITVILLILSGWMAEHKLSV